MKTIIIYNGITGFTKRYAQWIAEELGSGALPYKDFTKNIINENDIIIFGSRVHVGKVEKANKIIPLLGNNKNLIVFATGGTPASETNTIEKIWVASLTRDEINVIPHFYFQSGMNYEKMGFADRTIMKAAARLLDKKKNKSAEEAGFEEAIRSSHDISSREYILPLVEFVRGKYNLG